MRIAIPALVIPLSVVALCVLVPGLKDLPWTALRIGGLTLAVLAYVLVLTARIQLAESFSVRPEAKGLVIHGLYARIRNPMYVFVDLMIFGVIVAFHLYWLLLLLVPLIFLQARQAHREAKVLQDKFGEAYLGYRERTWF
jgi:protein-S-isoprenylcysteine O-methyltransferase Ste14